MATVKLISAFFLSLFQILSPVAALVEIGRAHV